MEWNITPKVSPRLRYLLPNQIIPAIQSNKDMHIFTQSLYLVIFHTAHRATGSSSLVVSLHIH